MKRQESLDPILADALEQLKATPQRDAEAVKISRRQFLQQARRLAASRQKQETPVATWRRKLLMHLGLNHNQEFGIMKRSLSSITLLILVVALLLGGTVVTASATQHALPGDTLYRVKTSGESARLTLAFDRLEAAELHLQFAQRRLTEMDQLLEIDRHNDAMLAAARFERHISRAVESLSDYSGEDAALAAALAEQITTAMASLDSMMAAFAAAIGSGQDLTVRSFQPSITLTQSLSIELIGEVQEIQVDFWVISGLQIGVTADTEIQDGITLGSIVKVHASIDENGDLNANEIRLADNDDEDEPEEVEFHGEVQSIGDSVWEIGGQMVMVTPDTEIEEDILVGDIVKVEAILAADGTLTALEIELEDHDDDSLEEIEFTGEVQAIGDSVWEIGGQMVMVTPDTEIEDDILVGDIVKVKAILAADGTLTALEIELEDHDDDHDPFEEIEFTGEVQAIGDTVWQIGGQMVQVTPDTEIEDDILVGDIVKVKAILADDGTLTALEIELEDHDDDSLEDIEFTGEVQAIGDTVWQIGGQMVQVTPDTEIEDDILVGDIVKVEAILAADGTLTALEIELEDHDDDPDDGDVDDDDDGDVDDDDDGDIDDDDDDDDDDDEEDNDDDDDEDESDDEEDDD